MGDIYKLTCKPNATPKFHKLSSGDAFVIRDEINPVKVGEQYKEYPAFISSIVYAPKRWWQFWKKKKQLGYVVKWK